MSWFMKQTTYRKKYYTLDPQRVEWIKLTKSFQYIKEFTLINGYIFSGLDPCSIHTYRYVFSTQMRKTTDLYLETTGNFFGSSTNAARALNKHLPRK